MASLNLSQVQSNIQVLQNLVLVTPGRAGYKPIQSLINGVNVQSNDPTFVFNFEGEQKQGISVDITDHFVEDNTARQDDAAIKPETYQTQGFIGELTDIIPGALLPLQTIADKLTIVSAMTPALSIAALVALNRAVSLYNTAANAISAASNTFGSLFFGSTPQTKQEQAYNLFKKYVNSRTLFTVQTPWSRGPNILTNMMIKDLMVIQDGDTESFSTFEVAFKAFNTASTNNISNAQFQQRAAQQAALANNLGTNSGTPTTQSPSGAFKAISGGQ